MSCYEWERGEFKLSVKEYAKFKKSFLNGIKTIYEEAYNDAITLYNRILKEAKGKRNNDWFNLYQRLRNEIGSEYVGGFRCARNKDLDPFDLAMDSMFRKKDENGRRIFSKPLKPRKSDFKNTNKKGFNFEEASISFRDDGRIIYWDVQENNHACDRASEHPLGKLFFKCLGAVNWTRGTGGTIVGNDEYRREDTYAGGGGNYIKTAYGPLGKEQQKFAYSF